MSGPDAWPPWPAPPPALGRISVVHQVQPRKSPMTIGLLLTVSFLILKLTGYINWNWILVFLPVIIEFAVSFSYARSPFWWRGRP